MNQAELINAIAQEHDNAGVSKSTIKWVLDAQAKVVQRALSQHDEITLSGIGKLTAKSKAARTGRNPKTGDEIEIPAKTVPHFSASKALKDAVA